MGVSIIPRISLDDPLALGGREGHDEVEAGVEEANDGGPR